MNANFFQNISAMQVQGEWVICIKQTANERMTVSVLFKDDNCGDPARKMIPPLIFSEKTAEELDEFFFTDLNVVIPETAKTFSSMEHYLKQREEAKKQSAMEKEKEDKEKKEKEERKKKYEAALKQAEELEKEGKHREAWLKIPDPAEYPEQAEAIRKRKSELSAKFAPNLFETSKNETQC